MALAPRKSKRPKSKLALYLPLKPSSAHEAPRAVHLQRVILTDPVRKTTHVETVAGSV